MYFIWKLKKQEQLELNFNKFVDFCFSLFFDNLSVVKQIVLKVFQMIPKEPGNFENFLMFP